MFIVLLCKLERDTGMKNKHKENARSNSLYFPFSPIIIFFPKLIFSILGGGIENIYSVMQSDGNKFGGDVVLRSVNMVS